MGRAVNAPTGSDLAEVLRVYLDDAKTRTACELAKKAVVLLEPRLGEVVWPIKTTDV